MEWLRFGMQLSRIKTRFSLIMPQLNTFWYSHQRIVFHVSKSGSCRQNKSKSSNVYLRAMALGDILSLEDVLERHGMRPWWETLRSISILLLISSAVVFFSPNSSAISCTALRNNYTGCASAQSGYVDDKCLILTIWLVRNLPWLGFLASAVGFTVNNVWLYVPKICRCIEETSSIAKAIIEIENKDSVDITEKAETMCFERKSITAKDESNLVVHSETFFSAYRIRNIISLSYFLLYGIGCTYFLLESIFVAKSEFVCTISTKQFSCHFICLHIHLLSYRLFLIIHLVASGVQSCLLIWQLVRSELRTRRTRNKPLRGVDLLGDMMNIDGEKLDTLKRRLTKATNATAAEGEHSNAFV